MQMEHAEYRLKAMNCPMHNLIYASRQRSYRELPLRLFEFGAVYRFEKSGVVHGLTRVRAMTQDDSHSYVTTEQAPAEIEHLLRFLTGLLSDFGLDDYYFELSTRDDSKPDKFIGMRRPVGDRHPVLEETALKFGARPGPRSWRCGVLRPQDLGPGQGRHRPHLADVDDPVRLQPACGASVWSTRRLRRQPARTGDDRLGQVRLDRAVHRRPGRALRGRVPAVAPRRCRCRASPSRSVTSTHLHDVARHCKARGLRVEVDDSDDRMQKKIRNAQLQKVPFMVIAGDQDVEAGAVSFRYRDGRQDNGVPVAEAIERVASAVASREQV